MRGWRREFLYYPQALWNAQHYHLPLTIVACNNRSYLNDKAWLWQRQGPAAQCSDYSSGDISLPDVDFVSYARAVGAQGRRVEHASELAEAVATAIRAGETWVLDVAVDPTQ